MPLARLVAIVGLVAVGLVTPIEAVTRTAHAADPFIEVTGACTLAKAIADANTGSVSADCSNHDPGVNVIRITPTAGTAEIASLGEPAPGVAVDLTAAPPTLTGGARTALPDILGDVVIEGAGDDRVGIYAQPLPPPFCTITLVNGVPTEVCSLDTTQPRGARLIHVAPSGSLTLRNLTLAGGDISGADAHAVPGGFGGFIAVVEPAVGVLGGAIYAEGPLTLDHVTLADNVARSGGGGRIDHLGAYPYHSEFVHGASAEGGAVYAAGPLSVGHSLLRNNRVVGGPEGGTARGGAIALAPTVDASISDSILDRAAAFGGDGTAGANGADGSDGPNGAAGTCVGSAVVHHDPDGVDGQQGYAGVDGEDGGFGGNAVGVVAGGRNVSIDHSAVIGSVARAGAAGRGGIGGIGGDGGDGGAGVACGSGSSSTGHYIPILTWTGTGGAGALAGDNGRIGTPGDRGTAVATFDVGGRLDLVDVTVAYASAVVPDDVYPEGRTAAQWEAARTRALQTVGHHGEGGASTDTPGSTPNANGSPDHTILDREAIAAPGAARGFGSSPTMQVNVSYSTITDFDLTVPTARVHRGADADRYLTLATGVLRGNVLWNPGSKDAPCLNMDSNDKNVHDTFCLEPGTTHPPSNGDVVTTSRPVDTQFVSIGTVVRPGMSIDEPAVRMPVLRLVPGSRAIDVGNLDSIPPPECVIVGGGTIGDDARHGPRDTHCDSGAFELDRGTTLFVWTPPEIYLGDTTPRNAYVQLESNPGPTTLTLTVAGLQDDVQFPPGFTPTANNHASPRYNQYSIDLTGTEDYPLVFTVPLVAAAGSLRQVEIDTELAGGSSGTLTALNLVAVVDDGLLHIGVDAPATWAPCQGWLPITYVATSDGHSPVPAAEVRLLPKLVEFNPSGDIAPRNANGTVVEPGPGTTATDLDGDVTWHLPPMAPGDAPRTITVYVAVGLLDNFQNVVYRPGGTIHTGATWTFPSDPSRPDSNTQSVLVDQYPTVRVRSDVNLLTPTTTDTRDGPPPRAFGAGETRSVWIGNDPTAGNDCQVPLRSGVYGPGPLTVNVSDPGRPGSPSLLPGGAAVPANPVFFHGPESLFNLPAFTAPMTPGPHQLLVDYTGPDGEVVRRPVTYWVAPATVTGEHTSASESTTTRTFTLGLNYPLSVPVDVDWATAPLTAGAADFVAASGTVVFQPGETSHTFTVDVVEDDRVEPNEEFTVHLTPGTGFADSASLRPAWPDLYAQIVDDDLPVVSIADTSGSEGTGAASTTMTFTVTLDQAALAPVTVDVATAPGTASTADYTPTATTVTFAPGETSQTVSVPVTADAAPEDDEAFTATLSNATNATVGTATATATILDDDTWVLDGDPRVSVNEGDPPPATSTVEVTMTLNGPAPLGGLQFDWATADGTATAPGDYVAASGTVTIAAGASSATVQVQVVRDTAHEATESFGIHISNLRTGTAGQAVLRAVASVEALDIGSRLQVGTDAVVTITDNDPVPTEPTTPSTTDPGGGPTTTPSAPPGTLPVTGQDLGPVVPLAAVAVLAGLVMTTARRRRRRA